MSVILDIFIAAVIGVAGLLGLLVMTYFTTLFLDRFCSSNFTDGTRIFSPISRQAQLWGLTLEERRAIVNHILVVHNANENEIDDEDGVQQTTTTSSISAVFSKTAKKKKTNALVEIEMTDLSSSSNVQAANDPAADSTASNTDDLDTTMPESSTSAASSITGGEDHHHAGATSATTTTGVDHQHAAHVEVDVDAGDEELGRTCAICLKEYEPNDSIVSGVLCRHKFHRTCILEWMETGHDDCPYCRNHMMTPCQMRQAAIHVLGDQRVLILSRGAEIHNITEDSDGDHPTPAVSTASHNHANNPINSIMDEEQGRSTDYEPAAGNNSALPGSCHTETMMELDACAEISV